MKRLRYLRDAEGHLTKCDPILAGLVAGHGRCQLRVGDVDLFTALIRIVISQQISGKAADSISDKIERHFANRGLSPATILRARTSTLQECGLSSGKLRTIKAVARAIVKGELDLAKIHDQDDAGVAAQLLPIVGIGPWSVDMVLMFVLGRPDVLPVGDYGLRAAIKRHYNLHELPDADTITTMAEKWRPYRTVATWYMWRSLGGVPVRKRVKG